MVWGRGVEWGVKLRSGGRSGGGENGMGRSGCMIQMEEEGLYLYGTHITHWCLYAGIGQRGTDGQSMQVVG